MPRVGVVATMRVKEGRGREGIGVVVGLVEGVVILWCGVVWGKRAVNGKFKVQRDGWSALSI